MAAFSRLQLAAALLEYDNDNPNPNVPRRSAQESAIFAPMRRAQARPRPASRRATDFLSVALPSDTQGSTNRKSFASHRKSQASIDALRNPFGADGYEEESDGESEAHDVEDMEVDLASWGLDAFAPKDKSDKRKSRGRAKSATLAGPGGPTRREPSVAAQIAAVRSRSMSVGNWDGFGLGGAFLEAETSSPTTGARPHSVATPLDLVGMAPPDRPPHLRRHSDHILIDKLPSAPPLHSVPFPSSTTPAKEEEFGVLPRPSSRSSRLDLNPESHRRTQSNASMGSQNLLRKDGEDNTFAVPPPSADRASRFDPKARASRALSTTSRDMLADENNPSALRPPSPTRTSRLDPKTSRGRTQSNASLGSRIIVDGDGTSFVSYGGPRDHPYSKWDLMRPKVLIMPSPLQNASQPAPGPPPREGFQLSTDGTPLPPGARSDKRTGALSTVQLPNSLAVPQASDAFVPNPRSTLSLAQLMFRNTLTVDGQRDAAYSDLDAMTPRATVDGEQAEFPLPVPEPQPIEVIVDEPEDALPAARRPAGKLYGRSLIDNLEARKAEMRGKTRTYMGGDRPSMMDRPDMQRSTTFIDSAALQRPLTQHMNSFDTTNSAPALGRRQSTLQPLLNFDGDTNAPARRSANPAMIHSRSVFGVDTLWEREMAKLKEMEASEKAAAEEQRKREEEEEALGNNKKGKKQKKGKGKELLSPQVETTSPVVAQTQSPSSPTPSNEPGVLPEIQRVTVRKVPPPAADDDSESESEGSDIANPAPRPSGEVEGWNSSDDEGPRRTTGVGPRYPNANVRTIPAKPVGGNDEDSEEDLPLAATISRAVQRTTQLAPPVADDDSDEEKPLSTLLDKAKLSIPAIDFDRPIGSSLEAKPSANDDDDDEQPLALRASTLFPSSAAAHGTEEDDDVPLALHPDQQRRSHYNLLVAQQQQQQMLQAQAMQSMFFSPPSVMGSGFFNPAMVAPPMAPMGPMMMMPPPQLPSPPPLHDTAKLNRVDRWRREVSGGV